MNILANAAQSLSNDEYRAIILFEVARLIPEESQAKLMAGALQAAFGIYDDVKRANVLARIAPGFPDSQAVNVLQDALRSSKTIGDVVDQSKAFAFLLDKVPGDWRDELAAEAMASLALIQHSSQRCAVLRAISKVCDPMQLRPLVASELVSATSAGSDRQRSAVLCLIAPMLTEDQLAMAWSAAISIRNTLDRKNALSALSDLLPETLVNKAFRELHQVSEDIRDELTLSLAPRVPQAMIPEFVRSLSAMKNLRLRARALLAVTRGMTGDERQQALEESVELARSIGDMVTLAHALIAEVETGSNVLVGTASLVRTALDAVLCIPWSDGTDRIGALQTLAPHLTQDMLHFVLREAPLGGGPSGLALAMSCLRPNMSDELVIDMLSDMERLWPRDQFMELLASLGAAIPDNWRGKAFMILQNWSEDGPRIKSLAKLIPYVDDIRKDDALTSFAECAGRLDRRVVLEVLPEFVPVIIMTEGTAGVAQIARSILEVGRYFS